jgi:hypothetical protein
MSATAERQIETRERICDEKEEVNYGCFPTEEILKDSFILICSFGLYVDENQ